MSASSACRPMFCSRVMGSVLALLNRAHKLVQEKHEPHGFNIGAAAGQAGVRCVLARRA